MCRRCLVHVCPQRDRTCLSSGSYLLNFKGCGECGKMEFIKIAELEKNETETDETVTYQHQCSECSHKIADHEYTFTIDGEYQEYAMNCVLCGYGEDRVSIMPDDPEKIAQYDMY
ncbi:churchill domain containing 1, putative [Acanthamoeba castellanii str. Neff]|uniref:Protein Churchill n=1 Tax=Acanthamoeba castellanii (strain ATCC 30010 / Neff) TaxID=1257118 RepID=L8HKL9_ACACF|nr:churchill domain containing 1, putative [Acanthamoeba castellanii str. Neff]ELR25213.1 churchill domain containing 1, putative [Acanthamoeba castellanii str. Neff]